MEVTAQVERMLAGNQHFSRLWRFEPAEGYDRTASAFTLNIAKVVAGFGRDEPMARAVCIRFCEIHKEQFNHRAWPRTWGKACAHKKEREGRSDNSQVHKYPLIQVATHRKRRDAGPMAVNPEMPGFGEAGCIQHESEGSGKLCRETARFRSEAF
jgi:hypothetical protein